jgi:hypothetical protein
VSDVPTDVDDDMRTTTRRAGMVLGLVTALGAAGLPTATAATPAADRIDYGLAAEIITAAWEVDEALDRIGLTPADLALPERDDDLYEQVAAGLDAWLDAQPGTRAAAVPAAAPRASEEERLTAERLAYAGYIAQVNSARDRRAGALEDEIVYMYLSHYVDVPRGLLPGLADASNHDQYLSAWIADDDRFVYDRFLTTHGTLEHANALKEAASTLVNLQGAITHPVREGLNAISGTAAGLDLVGGGKDLKSAFDAWRNYLGSTSDDPARVVQTLTDGSLTADDLDEKSHDGAVALLGAGVGVAAAGGGPLAWAGAGAVQAVSMAYFGVRTLAQQANYASMIASNQGRYSERLWRFMMGG